MEFGYPKISPMTPQVPKRSIYQKGSQSLTDFKYFGIAELPESLIDGLKRVQNLILQVL